MAQGALDELATRGYDVVGRFGYDPRDVNMHAFVRNLAGSRPDVVFVSAYLHDAIVMRREMVRQGLDVLVGIGTSSSYCMPKFGSTLGEDAVGLFASDKPASGALNVAGLTPDGRTLLERAQAAYAERFEGTMTAASAERRWRARRAAAPTRPRSPPARRRSTCPRSAPCTRPARVRAGPGPRA